MPLNRRAACFRQCKDDLSSGAFKLTQNCLKIYSKIIINKSITLDAKRAI